MALPDVPADLDGCCDLVDVLPARTSCGDKLLLKLVLEIVQEDLHGFFLLRREMRLEVSQRP